MERLQGLRAVWAAVDGVLRGVAETLQRFLRKLRRLRVLLIFTLLVVWGCALGAVIMPDAAVWLLAIAISAAVWPMIFLIALVSLPLRAKSIVRLVDQGYPDNLRELALRAAVRKLHEESIKTEQLLVETVWNESKKVLRRYRERIKAMDEEAETESTTGPAQGHAQHDDGEARAEDGHADRAARDGTHRAADDSTPQP